jgi:hypothetical protein
MEMAQVRRMASQWREEKRSVLLACQQNAADRLSMTRESRLSLAEQRGIRY